MKRDYSMNEFSVKKTKRRKIIVIALTIMLVVALSAAFCSCFANGKDGADGKDGQNGANATVVISEDGEIIANGKGTGVIAERADCEVSLSVIGESFGKVIGGGKYAAGETVAVQAVPNVDACFLGWRNREGETVSIEQKYVFTAEKGKTTLTAVFEKSSIEVNFRTNPYLDSYFGGKMLLAVNDKICEFKTVQVGYYDKFYEFVSPPVFEYGEEVKLKFYNFEEPSCKYKAILCVLTEDQYNNSNFPPSSEVDITDSLEYSFTITENRKYCFYFKLELNIFVEIVPQVDVAANDPAFGDVSSTECTGKGEEVTITATPKDSGTTDYIYDFAGWYSGGELVSESPSYTFKVNESCDFTAKFVKKYALKISASLYERTVTDENLDPDAYKVKFKSLTIRAVDKKGNFSSVTFGGNFGGGNLDGGVKICGYFEAGEIIHLSSDIESAHESYYIKDKNTGDKEYKEKFVYSSWTAVLKSGSVGFANGSSADYIIDTDNAQQSATINVELYVLLDGDKILG